MQRVEHEPGTYPRVTALIVSELSALVEGKSSPGPQHCEEGFHVNYAKVKLIT
jgi:hypothetical protein